MIGKAAVWFSLERVKVEERVQVQATIVGKMFSSCSRSNWNVGSNYVQIEGKVHVTLHFLWFN